MNRTQRPRSARHPRRRTGFTLVEIMIVVLIIGVLLNIAAPSFIGARDKAQARTCVKNLTDFVTAKEQYVMENKVPASNTTAISWSNIKGYIHSPSSTDPLLGPPCPTLGSGAGNYYFFDTPANLPSCPYGTSGNNPLAIHKL